LPDVTGICPDQTDERANLFIRQTKILLETLVAARQNTAV
jgi:hypothetical protein